MQIAVGVGLGMGSARKAGALRLAGAAGDYASAPDSAGLSVTGDIDVRAWVALTDWTPAAINEVVAKFTATGNQRSFVLRVRTTGELQLTISGDGTTTAGLVSTAATGITNGARKWIRGTWRQSDGRIQYFLSDNGTDWTQLGTDVTAAVASIFDSSAILEIGANTGGTLNPLAGDVYRVQVYSGIGGTKVFDADFTAAAPGSTSITDGAGGATVTLNGNAAIVAQ